MADRAAAQHVDAIKKRLSGAAMNNDFAFIDCFFECYQKRKHD